MATRILTTYREVRKYCGDYLDVQVFPVYRKATWRKRRSKPSSDIQQRLNKENAAKKLTQLLHTNFRVGDFALHLTYNEENYPEDDETARRDVQNFLRRLRRFYTNTDLELKYVWVTEKGKRRGRIHHHLVINGGVDRTEIENLWGKGYANTKALQFTKDGLIGLSNYIIKEPLFYNRWSSSRNLKPPIEKTNDYRFSRRKSKEFAKAEGIDIHKLCEKYYPGYFYSEIKSIENTFNKGIYLTIRLYKKTAYIM